MTVRRPGFNPSDKAKKKARNKGRVKGIDAGERLQIAEERSRSRRRGRRFKKLASRTTAAERNAERPSGLTLNERFRLNNTDKRGKMRRAMKSDLKSTTAAERATRGKRNSYPYFGQYKGKDAYSVGAKKNRTTQNPFQHPVMPLPGKGKGTAGRGKPNSTTQSPFPVGRIVHPKGTAPKRLVAKPGTPFKHPVKTRGKHTVSTPLANAAFGRLRNRKR